MKILYYRHNKNNPASLIEENSTNFVELTILLSGHMVYYINRKRIVLDSGDILYSPPAKYRSRERLNNCDYISFNVADSDISMNILQKGAVDSVIKDAILIADNIFEENYNVDDERLKLIYNLITNHLQHRAEIQDTNKIVIQIKQYVKNNLVNKITLADISARLNYTAIYCDSVFKQNTGTSIIEYVIGERIKKAKSMLIEGCHSLENVSVASGFSDTNYFSRVFKKYTGYTPSQYKKLFV